MKSHITIASAADQPYFPGLLVSLGSALACATPGTRYRVVVLDGGLSRESTDLLRQSFSRIAAARQIQVSVEVFQLDHEAFRLLPAKRGSKMFYGRLLLPSLLADETEVIYLDADVLCYRGVENLPSFAPDTLIAGAVDPGIPTLADDCPWADQLAPGEGQLSYLNSGVLWMNLAAFREERLVERAIELRSKSSSIRLADQSVINFICRGRAALVEESFNLLVSSRTNSQLNEAANLHFYGGKKPWQPRPQTGTITATFLFRQAYDAFAGIPDLDLLRLSNPPGVSDLRARMFKNIFNVCRSYRYFRAIRQLRSDQALIAQRARQWRDRLTPG